MSNATTKPAVAGPLDLPVGRPVPERAGLAAKIVQARALHDLALTFGAKPGSERSANDVSREAAAMDAEIEGELWSWVRSVMSQGADIRCDYDQGVYKGYEAYSARLDVAAIERSEELLARLKTPNVKWAEGGLGPRVVYEIVLPSHSPFRTPSVRAPFKPSSGSWRGRNRLPKFPRHEPAVAPRPPHPERIASRRFCACPLCRQERFPRSGGWASSVRRTAPARSGAR